MPTKTELRKDLQLAINKVRCIECDKYRDPIRVAEEYIRYVQPLMEKLERLRASYRDAGSMIAGYRERIAELDVQLNQLDYIPKIQQLERLVEQVNRLQKRRRIKAIIQRFTRSAVDIHYMRKAYYLWIGDLERLQANDGEVFKRRQEKLVKMIEAAHRTWDEFIENRLCDESKMEALLNRVADLVILERDAVEDQVATKLENTVTELKALMGALGADFVGRAMMWAKSQEALEQNGQVTPLAHETPIPPPHHVDLPSGEIDKVTPPPTYEEENQGGGWAGKDEYGRPDETPFERGAE